MIRTLVPSTIFSGRYATLPTGVTFLWAAMNLPLLFLVLAVCLVIFGSVLAIRILSNTLRYRTEPDYLLSLLDPALDNSLSEDEWNAVPHYPIRHDDYLDGIHRVSPLYRC